MNVDFAILCSIGGIVSIAALVLLPAAIDAWRNKQ